MNYTSIEQSKKLVELGLDPSTADCSYCLKGTKDGNDYYSKPDWCPVEDKTDIPCWSVGRIMELMCKGKDWAVVTSFGYWGDEEWQCQYHKTYDFETVMSRSVEHHSTHDKTLIGACYQMMVWLLKNKKL